MTEASDAADRRLPLAALVFGALVIGLSPILVRLAACGPAAAGFWRLGFAAPLLFLVARRGAGKGVGAGVGRPSAAMLLAGLAFALDLGCWHYGIRYTSVANAIVLPNLTPVLVTVAGWLVFKERPRAVFLVGLVAAIGGAVLMAEAAAPSARGGPNQHLGDLLSASTAVWYGLYFLAVRQARFAFTTGQVMLWSSLTGAPLLLAAALLLREQILPATAAGWAASAGLGLVHVFGQGAIAWALGRLPPSTASLVVLVQPVAAVALGYLIFREALTPLQAAGAAIALGGVIVAQRAPPIAVQPAPA
ncbi:MAG: DMT family transporter [Caulobacterales bacterium]